jgi:hypothetical protein
VRVHVALDREHSCYNSFTLCRGCTHSPWVVIPSPISKWLHLHFAMRARHIHAFFQMRPVDHYKAFQWFHQVCNVPSKVSPSVWASHSPRSPLLCFMGSSHCSFTHTFPRISHRNVSKHPSSLPSQLSCTAGWYVKTRLHHILRQAIPIWSSWLYYFHGSLLHEPVLRFGYDN